MIQDVITTKVPKASDAAEDKVILAAEKLRKHQHELKMQQLNEVARSFESVFLNMLMRSMRQTVDQDSMFSGGRGEEIFTGMFDLEVAQKSATSSSGIGIAKMIVGRYAKNVYVAEGSNGQSIDRKG